jgi:hypothetical protein
MRVFMGVVLLNLSSSHFTRFPTDSLAMPQNESANNMANTINELAFYA